MFEDPEQRQLTITKCFPYFILWTNHGKDPCEGYEHCRSIDEAGALATTRIIFGDVKESVVTLYFGDFWGKATKIGQYCWSGKDVVFQEIKRRGTM